MGAPPELLDPNHPTWTDTDRYIAFMAERDWPLPARERAGLPASPANRRQAAAAGWALEAGITNGSHPDWHQLRGMGLIA